MSINRPDRTHSANKGPDFTDYYRGGLTSYTNVVYLTGETMSEIRHIFPKPRFNLIPKYPLWVYI